MLQHGATHSDEVHRRMSRQRRQKRLGRDVAPTFAKTVHVVSELQRNGHSRGLDVRREEALNDEAVFRQPAGVHKVRILFKLVLFVKLIKLLLEM